MTKPITRYTGQLDSSPEQVRCINHLLEQPGTASVWRVTIEPIEHVASPSTEADHELRELIKDALGPVIGWVNYYKQVNGLNELHPIHSDLVKRLKEAARA